MRGIDMFRGKRASLGAIVAALALLLACASTTAAASATAGNSACGVSSYSYAGVQSAATASGVTAEIVATSAPTVSGGHVAGWIGIGGPNAGPKGQAEWLQAGLSSFAGSTTNELYYEVTLANAQPQYHEVSGSVAIGTSTAVSLVEIAHRPGWWQVEVDGKTVSAPISLPGTD